MKNSTLSRWLTLFMAILLLGATGCSKQAKAKRHLGRADNYFAAGDYEKAEIEYISVLRLQATNQPALRGLAQIYFEDEMLQNAGGLLGLLKKANTNDIDARSKLARVLLA